MPVDPGALKGRLVVAYDGKCAACSGLAQHITIYGLDAIAVAERDSAALHEHLRSHGLNAPGDRPYIVTATAPPVVRTGLRMRLAMARTLGVRHFLIALRLMAADARATARRVSAHRDDDSRD